MKDLYFNGNKKLAYDKVFCLVIAEPKSFFNILKKFILNDRNSFFSVKNSYLLKISKNKLLLCPTVINQSLRLPQVGSRNIILLTKNSKCDNR